MKAVSPEIQKVFALRMAAGRFFGPADTVNAEPAIVVNQAFARDFSPDKHDPAAILGKTLLSQRKMRPMRVIGVLDDEHQQAVADAAVPEVELPYRKSLRKATSIKPPRALPWTWWCAPAVRWPR